MLNYFVSIYKNKKKSKTSQEYREEEEEKKGGPTYYTELRSPLMCRGPGLRCTMQIPPIKEECKKQLASSFSAHEGEEDWGKGKGGRRKKGS